jgi:hypothetical protein
MVTFAEPGRTLSPVDISEAENALGVHFPASVRDYFLKTNGGRPELYVFENDYVDTVVSECFPLARLVEKHEKLVRDLGLVPHTFVPFAVDGGGDYFFLDTASDDGDVYFYRSEEEPDERVLPLGLGLEGFLATLRGE